MASFVPRPLIIGAAASLAALLPLSGLAQQTAPAAARSAEANALSGARYLESCKNASTDGNPMPGCPGALHGTDIEQLKQEALRTKNPQLFTMLGDVYQSNRAGMADPSQAYRWYVLAAVRGDPEAMARLSEMYKTGKGTAQDKVKALGYARLTQKMAPAGSAAARQAKQTVRSLGGKMASSEITMAEQFAGDLEQQLTERRPSFGSVDTPSATGNVVTAPVAPVVDSRTLPGMGAASIISGVADPASYRSQGAASAAASQPLPGAGVAGPGVPGMSALSGAPVPLAPPAAATETTPAPANARP
jgi:TPR repeat protein